MEVVCLTLPATAEVVEMNGPLFELANGRELPIAQTDSQAGDFLAEDDMPTLNRLRQPAPLARGPHRRRVADFGLNANDV